MKDNGKRESESDKSAEEEVQAPDILEEIEVEDIAVDGICGVY